MNMTEEEKEEVKTAIYCAATTHPALDILHTYIYSIYIGL